MTTMESANESARHAVNAIIDHYLAHNEVRDRATQPPIPPLPPPTGGMSDELDPLAGPPEFRMTPIGEYCRIWDPEQHELPELEPLRELDAKLYAAGLPHVWDVLQLEPLALPLLEAAEPADDARALRSFVERVRGPLEAMVNMV